MSKPVTIGGHEQRIEKAAEAWRNTMKAADEARLHMHQVMADAREAGMSLAEIAGCMSTDEIAVNKGSVSQMLKRHYLNGGG